MENVTLALALLLGTGFLFAKTAQFFRLPSVTGYICAGLFLGPSGLHIITIDRIGHQLGHFTEIALMLIAFGIGEHIERTKLRNIGKSLGLIGLTEALLTFLLVVAGTFAAASAIGIGGNIFGWADYVMLAILLGAVSIATAPASTLLVVRESGASGPLTTTLMAIIALDNGLAIMLFGIVLSIVRHFADSGSAAGILTVLLASFGEILFSLIIGVITGFLIDFMVHRLSKREEMLIAGLSLLLLCGELARSLEFSPLLAGMAAGFTIVNRDERDVRLFRTLNSFEPPIHVLFFTLAGVHLDFNVLAVSGWIGLAYFLCRTVGKISGASLGAYFTVLPSSVKRYLGLTLVPQAGVAIGLVFLIADDATLVNFSAIITPVVLTGVFISELAGPVCSRIAISRAGEATIGNSSEPLKNSLSSPGDLQNIGGLQMVPWTWGKLQHVSGTDGVVIYGSANRATVCGLARMTTLIAYHLGAAPMAVRVISGNVDGKNSAIDDDKDFADEIAEVDSMGCTLKTATIYNDRVPEGILAVASQKMTRAIVLGHPPAGAGSEFKKVVETVAARASCPVIVVRFSGILHTERILVPVSDIRELDVMHEVLGALSNVGQHRLTLLMMLPGDASDRDIYQMQKELFSWARQSELSDMVSCQVHATEARLKTIIESADWHDLLIMAANQATGLQKFFLGSLAESVADNCRKPMLIIHKGKFVTKSFS